MRRDSVEWSEEDGARHLFEAPIGDWRMGLSLPSHSAAGHRNGELDAVDAAMALQGAEPWIESIEDWLGFGVVPSPLAVSDSTADAALFDRHVCLAHPTQGMRLHLPWAALRNVGAPPQSLTDWHWRAVHCVVLLDTVTLDAFDAANLCEGAMLLLPASFTSPWVGRVQADLGAGCEAFFGAQFQVLPEGVSVLISAIPAAAPKMGCALVRSLNGLAVDPRRLLGWSQSVEDGAGIEITAGTAAEIYIAASSHGAARCVSGHLIHAGGGWGVLLSGTPPATISAPSST